MHPISLRSLNDLFVSDGASMERRPDTSLEHLLRTLGNLTHKPPFPAIMATVVIDRNAIPAEERGAADSIELNLHLLQRNAEEFRQAADLYLFAHTQKVLFDHAHAGEGVRHMIDWMKIAGRNGAIVGHSFYRLMEAINRTKATQIWAKCDLAKRKAATQLFALEFPKIAHVRLAAA